VARSQSSGVMRPPIRLPAGPQRASPSAAPRRVAGVSSVEQLLQSVEGRIRELNAEIASLQAARSALTSSGAPPTRVETPTAKRPLRHKPTSRTAGTKPSRNTGVLLADTAERMLAESDGLTTAALAMQAEANRDQVLALLRGLEVARRIRRTGQRRSTRWHAITDEDKIRERAADLANRSRRRRG
jgi:hypothetical protein